MASIFRISSYNNSCFITCIVRNLLLLQLLSSILQQHSIDAAAVPSTTTNNNIRNRNIHHPHHGNGRLRVFSPRVPDRSSSDTDDLGDISGDINGNGNSSGNGNHSSKRRWVPSGVAPNDGEATTSSSSSSSNSNREEELEPREEEYTTSDVYPAKVEQEEEDMSSTWKRIQKRLLQKGSFDIVPLPAEKQSSSSKKMKKEKKSLTDIVFSTKKSKSNHKKKKWLHGTTFDLRKPTPERITKWFAPSTTSSTNGNDTTARISNSSHRKRQQASAIFNHDNVGMTNPMLHVSVSAEDTADAASASSTMLLHHHTDGDTSSSISLAASTTKTKTTTQNHSGPGDESESSPSPSPSSYPEWEIQDSWIPASTTTSTTTSKTSSQKEAQPSANTKARVLQYKRKPSAATSHPQAAETAWWPATSSEATQKRTKTTPKSKSSTWRECRYRCRVGRGLECYERVRDAALQWQFQHNQTAREQGILPVMEEQEEDNSNINNANQMFGRHMSSRVQSLWSGPHRQGSRRLVTYTTTGGSKPWFLPRITLYTLNPVMVVYDLLDQRGPGTTYTSTAYATLQGHLLRGEERVTVALRDDSDFVDVEILSYSKPAQGLRAKLVWPMIGNLQSAFFEHQLEYLEQVAAGGTKNKQ
mgnify:CR=1 FL=1